MGGARGTALCWKKTDICLWMLARSVTQISVTCRRVVGLTCQTDVRGGGIKILVRAEKGSQAQVAQVGDSPRVALLISADMGHADSGIGSLLWSQVEVSLEEPLMEKDLSRLVQDGWSGIDEQVGEGVGRWWVRQEIHGMGHRAVGFKDSWLQAWRFRSRVALIDREVKGEFYITIMNFRS